MAADTDEEQTNTFDAPIYAVVVNTKPGLWVYAFFAMSLEECAQHLKAPDYKKYTTSVDEIEKEKMIKMLMRFSIHPTLFENAVPKDWCRMMNISLTADGLVARSKKYVPPTYVNVSDFDFINRPTKNRVQHWLGGKT